MNLVLKRADDTIHGKVLIKEWIQAKKSNDSDGHEYQQLSDFTSEAQLTYFLYKYIVSLNTVTLNIRKSVVDETGPCILGPVKQKFSA